MYLSVTTFTCTKNIIYMLKEHISWTRRQMAVLRQVIEILIRYYKIHRVPLRMFYKMISGSKVVHSIYIIIITILHLPYYIIFINRSFLSKFYTIPINLRLFLFLNKSTELKSFLQIKSNWNRYIDHISY